MKRKRINQAISKIAEIRGQEFGDAVKESYRQNLRLFPRRPLEALYLGINDQFVYGVDSTDADKQTVAILRQALPKSRLELAWRAIRAYIFRDEEYYPG